MKYALLVLLSLVCFNAIDAKGIGKVELAPAYIHIDVINAKKTVKELDMAGVRLDASYATEQGWYIKPTAVYSKERDGQFGSFGLYLGRTAPLGKKFYITPYSGVSYTEMTTRIHIGGASFTNRFRAWAPCIGVELIYNFMPNARACASYQYAWSRPYTKLKRALSKKSDAEGPAYGLLLEYDLNKKWSVNIGAGLNESFSRQKTGLRARGLKLGIARWF